MSRRLRRTAAAAYAASVVTVVTLPTVLLAHAAHRGSAMPTWRETGLVAVSVTVGAGYGVASFRRLSRTPAPTGGRGDGWVAAVGALVVLALLTPAFLGVTLYQLGPLQVPMADQPLLLYLLWATVHLAGVSAGELSRRLIMRWLR